MERDVLFCEDVELATSDLKHEGNVFGLIHGLTDGLGELEIISYRYARRLIQEQRALELKNADIVDQRLGMREVDPPNVTDALVLAVGGSKRQRLPSGFWADKIADKIA